MSFPGVDGHNVPVETEGLEEMISLMLIEVGICGWQSLLCWLLIELAGDRSLNRILFC